MRILIAATVSFAGMGPYVCNIFNDFHDENVFGFFVDDTNGYFSRNLSQESRQRVKIVQFSSSKWHKILGLAVTPPYIKKAFKDFCIENNIDVIHLLSVGPLFTDMADYIRKISKSVFVTVHDISPHEAKKVWYKVLRQKLIYKKLMGFYKKTDNLITNSHEQERLIHEMYPNKKVFYHAFPSLVTEEVANGKKKVPETTDTDKYILFFGRIEKYKGLDILYEAYAGSERLRNKMKLVIAGSGDIYFDIDPALRERIVLINRYIDNEEIADLYRHASCTVYPYISATQSGVLTLSCYFQVPAVVSDVPFFKEQVGEAPIAELFETGNPKSLAKVIEDVTERDNSEMTKAQKRLYETEYEKMPTAQSLMRIYSSSLT